MPNTVYIVAATRTAIGAFQGALSNVPATELGATVIKSVLEKANVKPEHVDEVIMGQVLSAGAGQAPARQAAIKGGIPVAVPCMTINKVCGSGLKAIALAADSIALGRSHCVIAGGMENMSLAPHLMEKSRAGYRMGTVKMEDSMLKDGLWDPYNNWHMGNAAELAAKEFKTTREQQDAYAVESYKRAQKAQADGIFAQEITPVTVSDGKNTTQFSVDEEPMKAKFDKMPALKTAFEKDGTITAANASKINDGAAAVLLMSEEGLKKSGAKPIAKIVSQGYFSQDPKWFTTAPVNAIKNAMKTANLTVGDIDQFEVNEAFALVAMIAGSEIKIPSEKLNPHGGAVALGHPIGASGARLITTLLHSIARGKAKRGLASLCIGGGEGIALIIEKA